jgi:hypothetical protein
MLVWPKGKNEELVEKRAVLIIPFSTVPLSLLLSLPDKLASNRLSSVSVEVWRVVVRMVR